jgi:thioredoxin reductase (NADPH)
MSDIHNLIIIGAGPAGLTAGIYAARADLEPIIITGTNVGGQLMTTTEVENFPGFPEGIQGPQLMMNMIKQAERFGSKLVYSNVTKVDFSNKIKSVWAGETEYKAKAIIIASGSSSRKLGIESEKKYWGKGVSTCATCDGAFYRGKVVAIVGGGDSAMEEANFLTKFATKVYIIHRKDTFKASKIMQERVFANEKIEVIWNSEIEEILGNDKNVTGVRLKNVVDQSTKNVDIDGFFLAIGHIPNVDYLGNEIELDELGFVAAVDRTKTNIEGVFVAGDVNDHHYQQAITAAGLGCMAFLDTEKWLARQ